MVEKVVLTTSLVNLLVATIVLINTIATKKSNKKPRNTRSRRKKGRRK
jgi:hypothetical protein